MFNGRRRVTASSEMRRQVYNLSPTDLKVHPAWIFASDEVGVSGQDEATVRPYTQNRVDPGDGLLVVRSKFKLADGTEFLGYVSPPSMDSTSWHIGYQQPVIVTMNGQVPLWFGICRHSMERVYGFLALMGKAANEVFPLSYRSDIPMLSGAIEGTLDGFCYLDDGKISVLQIT